MILMMVSAPTLTDTEARSVATVRELSLDALDGACDLAATGSAGTVAELTPEPLERLPGLVFGQLAALKLLSQLLDLFLGHWCLPVAGGVTSTLARLHLSSDCRG